MSLLMKVAMDISMRNNYTRFVVRPDLGKPCIYSGWDYESDAKDALKEMKEGGKIAKIVSRRTLEQSGVDPNNGDNWVKGLF